MLPGFNHNLEVENIVFHVQTEDKGISVHLVVSHVFVGGAIVFSLRNCYESFLMYPDSQEKIEKLMKTQHKAVLKKLEDRAIPKVETYIQSQK